MGRRVNYNTVGWRGSDERASLGDAHVETAINSLSRTALISATTMASYQPTREKTIDMLFRDDDIAAAKRVRGLVTASGSTRSYDIDTKNRITLNINYEECPVVAMDSCAMSVHSDRIQPLLTFVEEVKAVHDRFEEVKGVLRWMNRNATPGAIRYYWPTAMKLTPKSKVWEDLQQVPSRFTTPENIGDWTQAIKDSAATVASSLLLPADVDPRPRVHMWLTFSSKKVELSDRASYQTDQMHYNL